MTELYALALVQETALRELCRLGILYQAKEITPEVFAKRAHASLVWYQIQVKELNKSSPQNGSPK